MAVVIAQAVAKIVVPMISVGLAEPAFILTPIMVAGMMVRQEVLSARKVIMAGLAVSG